MKVIILRGASASSRSLYVDKLKGEYDLHDVDVFSEGNCEVWDGKESDAQMIFRAERHCFRDFVDWCKNNALFDSLAVINNPNRNAYEIAPYVYLSMYWGCQVDITLVLCSPEETWASMRGFETIPDHWPTQTTEFVSVEKGLADLGEAKNE